MTLISVCMCTYRRDQVLDTLDSIKSQELPEDVQLEIVVVDNDATGSAQAKILDWSEANSTKILYDIEPEKNIALARNRTVSLAHGEWIAFVDDDEVAAPTWIAELLATAADHKADIVMGAVLPIYPQDTPDWIPRSRVFERPLPPTGTIVKEARTSNALVRAQCMSLEREHLFLPEFGVTGGSDFELFHRLQEAGAKMVSCREAVVTELVEVNRINFDYLRRRAIRGGECYARVVYKRPTLPQQISLFATSLLKMAYFGCLASVSSVTASSDTIRLWLKMWQQLGKIKICLGMSPVYIYRSST